MVFFGRLESSINYYIFFSCSIMAPTLSTFLRRTNNEEEGDPGPKISTKPKDQECWNHATLQTDFKAGKSCYKWKCNYCNTEQAGNSVDRVRRHMAKCAQVM